MNTKTALFLLCMLVTVAGAHERKEGECLHSNECFPAEVIWDSNNTCLCDIYCEGYGDCCLDSDILLGSPAASCKHIQGFGKAYMISTCPEDWTDDETREYCEIIPKSDKDPLRKTPVTDSDSRTTYANIFCAVCRAGDSIRDLQFSTSKLHCPTLLQRLRKESRENITFMEDLQMWGVGTHSSVIPCNLVISLPQYFLIHEKCLKAKYSCEDEGNSTVMCRNTTYALLGSYTYYQYSLSVCDECDSDSKYLSSTLCDHWEYYQSKNRVEKLLIVDTRQIKAFPVLFDFKNSGSSAIVGRKNMCIQNQQLFDPFYKICRNILRSEQRVTVGNTTEINEKNKTKTCYVVLLNSSEFTLSSDNKSIFIEKFNQTLIDFKLMPSGEVQVCLPPFEMQTMSKFPMSMRYVTLIGLCISIVLLSLHLFGFCFHQGIRNLSDKNLASLCIVLISCYSTFIAMSEFKYSGIWCSVIALVMYYTLMTCFSWSLLIGFDIWYTLHLTVSKLRLSSGKQKRKFVLYSLLGWLLPLLLVLVLCFFEYSSKNIVSETLKPNFDESCWFSNRYVLLLFVAVPSGAVMLINFSLAFWSVFMIIKNQSDASHRSQHNTYLYVKLAIIMGLSWSFGLAAGYFDYIVLWYVFIICNTLQGLFIFVAFTCRKKDTRHLLYNLGCSKINTFRNQFSLRQNTLDTELN